MKENKIQIVYLIQSVQSGHRTILTKVKSVVFRGNFLSVIFRHRDMFVGITYDIGRIKSILYDCFSVLYQQWLEEEKQSI
jgi:hypothetical protein